MTNKPLKLTNRLSLKQQIITTFSIGILFFSVLSSIVISGISKQTLFEQFLQQNEKVTEAYARQSTLALLYQSSENAVDISTATLSFPDISYVAIYDTKHRLLYEAGQTARQDKPLLWPTENLHYNVTNDTLNISMPVITGLNGHEEESPFSSRLTKQEVIGFVYVVVSKKRLHAMISDILESNTLIALGLALVLLLFLSVITNRISQPLKHLAAIMHDAEQGETHKRAKLEGSSDLILMEQAFNTMMNELESREIDLMQARDVALDAARAKGEFAATVSHELRTPMNGVLGMLQLLQSSNLTNSDLEFVGVATSSAKALLVLIDDILDFSKIDLGKMKLHPEDFGIRELVADVVELLSIQSRPKNLMLNAIIDAEVQNEIRTDSGRLRQILINLLGNAIKFTEKGMVSIYVSQHTQDDKNKLIIKVEDTGVGISEDAQKRIFESFVQADASTTRNYGGTGLGLTISQQLIYLMGGELKVSSQFGEGTSFYFDLPLISFEPAQNSPSDNTVMLAHCHVLVVAKKPERSAKLVQTLISWGCTCDQVSTDIETANKLNLTMPDEHLFYDFAIIDLPGDTAFDDHLFSKTLEASGVRLIVLSDQEKLSVTLKTKINYLPEALDTVTLHRSMLSLLPSEDVIPNHKLLSKVAKHESPLMHLNSYHILVVEDNTANQIVAKCMLEKLGYSVEVAANGKEALAKLDTAAYDIILMDCYMPVMDGYTATLKIRKKEELNEHIPILAMTAHVNQEDRTRCITVGMDGHVTKPFDLDELEEKLSQWLSNSSRQVMGDPQQTDLTDLGGENLGEKNLEPIILASGNRNEKLFAIDTLKIQQMREKMGDYFVQMINAYLDETPRTLQKLQHAIAQNERQEIQDLAHSLKGSSLTIGAEPLAKLSKELEEFVNTGEQQIEYHLQLILKEYKEVEAALQDELFAGEKCAPPIAEQRQTILVVDDDRSCRFSLLGILERDDYNVTEATDGLEAVQKCQQAMPDLILMDAMMPDMDGFEACREILKLAETNQPIVLMITALHDEESIEKAFTAGATDFIPKPVNFMLLRKRVNRLLQSSKTEKQAHQLANYDSLTNIANRDVFLDRGRELIRRAYSMNSLLAMLYIDLDRFTQINETHGHEVGDLLLKTASQRIQGCIRSSDLVARVSGDGFAVMLDKISSPTDVAAVAEKIRETIARPFSFMNQKVFSHASIGISLYPRNGKNIGTMLKHADTALFRAKSKGGNCFQYYEYGMESEIIRKVELEIELNEALERNEFVLFYQPQLDLKLQNVRGVEALIRWQHPKRGLIPPVEFIPLAEECGLITKIGDWVLRTACEQQVAWINKGMPTLKMSVNVASEQLESGELFTKVTQTLSESKIAPDALSLEITENTLVNMSEATIEQMERIKNLGVTLEIDDFGTGYSSLSYLKRFPIETLKIDRTFIKDLPDDKDDKAIVAGIIALAHNLGRSIVAEGVETEEQKALLASLGCDCIQGYLLSRPLPSTEFEQWLSTTITA